MVTGTMNFAYIPFIYLFLSAPRTIAILTHFTFHAELLPHTEQIVFHKANYFGKVHRIYVDIKNLEKIDASTVPSKILLYILFFTETKINFSTNTDVLINLLI